MDTKRCPKCDADLPVDQFGKNRSTKDGLTQYCRPHWNEIAHRWRKRNPERHKEFVRNATLKSTYGITADEYDTMLAAQGGGCAICGAAAGKRRLSVDHDHATGAVRAILCTPCNAMLGSSGDNIVRLQQGIDYLMEHRG